MQLLTLPAISNCALKNIFGEDRGCYSIRRHGDLPPLFGPSIMRVRRVAAAIQLP